MLFSSDLSKRPICMWQRGKMLAKISALAVLSAGLVICFYLGMQHENRETEIVKEEIFDFQADVENLNYLKVSDKDRAFELNDYKEINLSDYREEVMIDQGGNYLLTGDLNGKLYVRAEEENVHLFFDGVNIHSKVGPAIFCEKTNKLIITLMENSVNDISDSGKYNDELDACIFSECNIIFNGKGKLNVNGYFKDAIKSKDVVKMVDGNYNIKCKRTGLHGNDGVVICDGEYIIASEKNGIKTTKKGGEGQGSILISGGKVSVIAGRYAFVSTKADLYIFHCSVYNKSIVDTYHVGGNKYVQEECVQ